MISQLILNHWFIFYSNLGFLSKIFKLSTHNSCVFYHQFYHVPNYVNLIFKDYISHKVSLRQWKNFVISWIPPGTKFQLNLMISFVYNKNLGFFDLRSFLKNLIVIYSYNLSMKISRRINKIYATFKSTMHWFVFPSIKWSSSILSLSYLITNNTESPYQFYSVGKKKTWQNSKATNFIFDLSQPMK